MLKTTFENYHINFSNGDFSVDIASICFKFLGYFFFVVFLFAFREGHSVLCRTDIL